MNTKIMIGCAALLIATNLNAQVDEAVREQVRSYAKILKDHGISKVVCSPLSDGRFNLYLYASNITNLSLLREMPIKSLILTKTAISDLSPLQGTRIEYLYICGTRVTDLSPLKDLPLEELRFDPDKITEGLDVVRGIKTLLTIGFRLKTSDKEVWLSAREFWARYAAGDIEKPAPAPALRQHEATAVGEAETPGIF